MLPIKQANRKNVTFLSSPLALLVLSACGGGGGVSAKWKKMKPYEANKIENELKQRMAKIAKTPPSLF